VNTAVETFVFWRAGWLLQVHHVEAAAAVVLRVGGFALPMTAAAVATAKYSRCHSEHVRYRHIVRR